LGTLNPLEVLRKAINDRHERRKDREYRESAERRRLELENQIQETELISKRITMARELGATKRDLAPLLNELVYRPILRLDRSQDRGVITYAELPDRDDEQQDHS
jgi:predicted NACHT family NTPase